ncbi:MAG: YncE family protein [Prevotella sp.]|nr:YncE family protein [Prevotella sp.]
MKKRRLLGLIGLIGLIVLSSCREEHLIVYAEETDTGKETVAGSDIVGMYVLNEGNMGSNKCTIDYLDLSGNNPTVHYWRNIYAERNPSVVKELGDVGNDIKIYGSRMWMVINCSDKVEVVRADNCERIGQVNIPNCRNVVFDDRYAYVSSFVGPVDLQAEAQIGMVYKVDTLSLEIVNTVQVGYQPEEMAIVGGKLYVANSGGYLIPTYDHTVSVIDLTTFKEEKKLDVDVNLHRCRADKYGQLWVSARGNYMDRTARLYWLEQDGQGQMKVGGSLPYAISDLCIVGDSLYYYGSEWSELTQRNVVTYGIINARTHEQIADKLTDAPEVAAMRMPYGIIVNPQDRDFYLMDAKNYVSSGELLHFLPDGTFDWKVTTGDIPAHACFLHETLNNKH